MKIAFTFAALALGVSLASAAPANPPVKPDFAKIHDEKVWDLVQADGHLATDRSLRLTVTGRPGGPGSRAGIAWIHGIDFDQGTIEVELKGKSAPPQRSFLGIAFHGVDEKTFEAVYFRPFNFKAAQPASRARAVQYIAWPDYTWERLRQERPNTFEQPVNPVPDPDRWFHVKLEVGAKQVRVFVQRSAEPTLVVDRLSDRVGGKVGLWVDLFDGQFRNLSITPAPRTP